MAPTSSTLISATWVSGFSLSFSLIERSLSSSASPAETLNSAVGVGRRAGGPDALHVKLPRIKRAATDFRWFEPFVLFHLGVIAEVDGFAGDRPLEGGVVFQVDVGVRRVEDELAVTGVVAEFNLGRDSRRAHHVKAGEGEFAFVQLVAAGGDVGVVADYDLRFVAF